MKILMVLTSHDQLGNAGRLSPSLMGVSSPARIPRHRRPRLKLF